MTMRLLFWILMLLWVLLWGVTNFGPIGYQHYGLGGLNLILFLLIGLLGWKTFGKPIDG